MAGIRIGGIAVVGYTSPPYVFITLPGYYNIWRVLNGVPVEMVGDSSDIDDTRTAPELSPDGTKIVYQKGPDGVPLEVWVCDIDGSNDTYIDGDSTAVPSEWAHYPSWSPDGSKVIYTWNDDGSSFGGEIRTANPDGTGVTTIWTQPIGPSGGLGAARRPRYSFDGTKIGFIVGDDGVGSPPEYGDPEIWTADDDGTNDSAIVSPLLSDPFDQCLFSWANTQNVLAYYTGSDGGDSGDIHSINADGTGDTDLSQTGGTSLKTLSDLAWAPDDSQVFFTMYDTEDQGLAFYVNAAEADGSGSALLNGAVAVGTLGNTLHSAWVFENRLWVFPDNAGVSFRDQLGSMALDGTDYVLGHDLDDTDGDVFYDETGFESR